MERPLSNTKDKNVCELNALIFDYVPGGDYAGFCGTLQAQTSTRSFENGLQNLKLCRPIHRRMSDFTLEQICQMTDPRGR